MTHRLAIIGLGIMGRRMLDNALQHPAFEVSGVWDPSAESIAKTQQLFPGVAIQSSAEAAMAGADAFYAEHGGATARHMATLVPWLETR